MYETNEFIDDIIDALKDVYKNDLNMRVIIEKTYTWEYKKGYLCILL